MRILLLAALLFITIHFIRLDLAEGTIPLASFSAKEMQCEDKKDIQTISVKAVEGDTIESLFALYPDPTLSFVERLASFYALNPHLQNQGIIGGIKIVLPLPQLATESCIELG
ncbi:hypothetical protein FITA111629_04810 [Filibacter tadaridae]|uniref:Uncharacterized protein n=1 Tax=Filibacter tadaridae TaxID=2483811 RepID=A0A3P5XTK9_9BACL|nr:hypothetical protein [Filibacter tadaridae]VDC32442.1 hypothetical protein FILTAD_02670 [Filibacter tadaridae]